MGSHRVRRSYLEGVIMLRIRCTWEENDHNHITLILPSVSDKHLNIQLLSVSGSFLPGRRDLSLGAPPALCCAPLVEEVLVCLHDLVKYVYMNDDQLV